MPCALFEARVLAVDARGPRAHELKAIGALSAGFDDPRRPSIH